MQQSLEVQIRERAYEIWNAVGRPDGQASEHWLAAERELLANSLAQAPTQKGVVPRKQRKIAQPNKRMAAG